MDYHFRRECPRCGEEAGWTGRIEEWEGRMAAELACPHCQYVFIHVSAAWERELTMYPPTTFVPGREAP